MFLAQTTVLSIPSSSSGALCGNQGKAKNMTSGLGFRAEDLGVSVVSYNCEYGGPSVS